MTSLNDRLLEGSKRRHFKPSNISWLDLSSLSSNTVPV